MSKFKVGDKVVCIETNQEECDVNGVVHGMTYVVEYIDKHGPEEEWLLYFGDSSAFAKRFKLVEEPGQNMVAQALTKGTEMTAEQIRNEILRINVRIEEAKKDIENAEKERDSLVEKLREKGFELTHHAPTNSNNQKLAVGDIVRILSYNEEYHPGNYTNHSAEVIKTDSSCRPYLVEVGGGREFWCTPEEVEKI